MQLHIEKINTKTNCDTLKINSYYLHSKYNPQKEAEQIAKKQIKNSHVHILFGYGLGYIAEAINQSLDKDSMLLVIDPLKEIINTPTNKTFNIINELTNENFGIHLGAKLEIYNRKISVICSPNYDKLFADEYRKLLKLIQEKLKINIVHENTIRLFAETWQRNYINNLFSAKMDYSMLKLHKKFNCPIVIASGGPSLSKQISILKKNMENVILIAAGSTINTLIKNGIQPDFVISIDGGDNNYNHFKDLNLRNSHLIYSMTNHYQIRDSFHAKCFFFLSNEFVNSKKIIDYTLDKNVPIIQGGASVANYAYSIASYISTGPIALIGQDLAYTDNKTHAEHNKHYKVIDEQHKIEKGMFYTKGYLNEEVLTDYVFFSMKEGFERLVDIVKHENDIYNCTEGGVELRGFAQETFKLFCEKFTTSKVDKDFLLQNNDIQYLDLLNIMKEEIRNYNKIIQHLNEGLAALLNNKSKLVFSSSTLNILDKMDNELEKLLSKVSMSIIANPISIDIHKKYQPKEIETKLEIFNRVINLNKELYSRLLDSAKISKEYTLTLVDKIEKQIRDDDNG